MRYRIKPLPKRGFIKTAICVLLLLVTFSTVAYAEFYPYESYDYKAYNKETISTIPVYAPLFTVGNKQINSISFTSPQDIALSNDICYVADTGANRIIALDFSKEHPVMLWEAKGFGKPNGVCVSGDELYVADTENSRIVVLSLDGKEKRIVPAPKIEAFTQDIPYMPKKVGVDGNGRIYVICDNITEGFVELDGNGNFLRYFGANKVKLNVFEQIVSVFLTKEQRANRFKPTPVSYSNLYIDSENFVYSSTASAADVQIKRLNTQGVNVLKRTEYSEDEFTKIVDIAVDEDENIFALDAARGRIFMYNNLGDRLSIFGGMGDALGTFSEASALACSADGRIFVVDAVKNSLTVFSPTEFGKLVIQANQMYVNGQYEEAAQTWHEVLRRNANYRLAYVGAGRAMQMQRSFEEAMYYFEKGYDKENYSLAFEEYRAKMLNNLFVYIVVGLATVVFLLWLFRKQIGRFFAKAKAFITPQTSVEIKKPSFIQKIKGVSRDVLFAGHVSVHPFDGFYDLKFYRKRTLGAAFVLLILLCGAIVAKLQLTGFIFRDGNPEESNILLEILAVILPVCIWSVVNWAITTLLDGKANFRMIFVATVFALVPLIIIYSITTLLSGVLSQSEGVFITVLDGFAVVWSCALLLFGLATVQEYGVFKTIYTSLLTLLTIVALIFLAVIFYSSFQQLGAFIAQLKYEIELFLR